MNEGETITAEDRDVLVPVERAWPGWSGTDDDGGTWALIDGDDGDPDTWFHCDARGKVSWRTQEDAQAASPVHNAANHAQCREVVAMVRRHRDYFQNLAENPGELDLNDAEDLRRVQLLLVKFNVNRGTNSNAPVVPGHLWDRAYRLEHAGEELDESARLAEQYADSQCGRGERERWTAARSGYLAGLRAKEGPK